MEFLRLLFDTNDFPARWQCGYWTPAHGWLHIVSDIGVWSAYIAIPFVLLYFVRRRRDLPFRKIFVLFGAFILACGTTHLMEAIIFWWPAYRLAGVIKLFTAIVSWATIIALIPIIPRVLAMRTPEELEREIAARKHAEEALQKANADLELRVQERTTALSQAVMELRDERELLRITLASISDAVIVTDAEGRISFMNSKAETLTEWSAEESHGQRLESVFRIVDETTREPIENPVARTLREGEVIGLASNAVLVGKRASERAIDDSAAPIRNPHGDVAGCVLVFRDITERRHAEQLNLERLATARLLASIVEFTDDAIIRTTLDGEIQSWNNAAQKLFGFSKEEAIGQNISAILPPDRVDEERQLVSLLLAGEHISHFDTVRRRRDGSLIDVSLTISAIKDEHDRIIGVSKTARDITEEKFAEKRIYSLMTDLKNADQRKDEFLATLAHELRNPLAPIRNSLEIIKRANGNHDLTSQAHSMMDRQLTQMVRLVDDLLDISRITRNKLELHTSKVELGTIIEQAIETCSTLIEGAGHHVTVDLGTAPIHLHADPIRLTQVFTNLLNNACKYTRPQGQIEVAAEVSAEEVVITIKDTGVGIPEAMLPKIFDIFTQVDRSLERSHGGLGIGLTLVKRLVEMHGGTIKAASAGPDRGSSFIVRLPVSDRPHPARIVPRNGESLLGSQRRILVVDDNRDSASSLAMLLKLTGNETEAAHDGAEALERAESFKPDVILLDIGMPKLNGFDTCKAIRSRPWGTKIVVIALTGWGQDEDRRKTKEAGFDGHLVKPVSYEALVALLSGEQRVAA